MEYDAIARTYDRFNSGFDYRAYLDKIEPFLTDLPEEKLALDCGCGTGSLLVELFRRGYDCSGVDASAEMLQVAQEKLSAAGFTPHLLCQTLPDLDLYGAYHAVFSSLDTLNHLTDRRELNRFFRRVRCFVEPGGYLIFDLKTREAFSDTAPKVAEEDGDLLILQGAFDGTYAQYDLTAFRRAGQGYLREDDTVFERYYPYAEVSRTVCAAGFRPVKHFLFRRHTVAIFRRIEL